MKSYTMVQTHRVTDLRSKFLRFLDPKVFDRLKPFTLRTPEEFHIINKNILSTNNLEFYLQMQYAHCGM